MINGVPRILIVRLSAIGDVVRVLPALHALRDLYPTGQIDWAVEPKSADIVTGHPALDQVLVFERGEGLLDSTRAFTQFCSEVRANRYDIVVDFHGILKSGMIMRASGAAKRLGFAPPRAQEQSHRFASETVALPSLRMNRIEENLELCKALGAKRHTLDVHIEVPEEVQDEVEEYFHHAFHGAKKVALLHAPVERPEKQWPLEHFAALSDLLIADGRFEVLLTYGPGQKAVADEVHWRARRKPVVAPGTPDLKHFAWLARQADVFFGGDTGPMHIASAMDTPVVAAFGGTDPALHAPLRQPSTVLYAGPANRARAIDTVNGPDYLRLVTPEMAYDAIVKITNTI
jgi:lipopolysaccharide heptosyltransferase I